MKATKLICPTVLALAVVLAATGCKSRQTVKTTTFPPLTTNPRETEPPAIANPPVKSDELPPISRDQNYTQDRTALASLTIHFAYDSSAIQTSEQHNLAKVASHLASTRENDLLVEGNCDERGTEEYNRSLGERRALAAREALIKLGVDPMRIRTLSNGKDRPMNRGHDENAWSQNRRDEFILLVPPK